MNSRLKNTIGMDMHSIKLVPYNPLWAEIFEENKERLQVLLKDCNIGGIEHVGSTSIPTCPYAKPIIDIGIRADDDRFDTDHFTLKLLDGLYRKGDCESFWNPTAVRDLPNEDVILNFLHIRDSAHIDKLLRFKRYLIEHPDVAEKYGEIKKQCVSESRDIGHYAKMKGKLLVDDVNTVAHLEYIR